ncbi:MAG: hypothetical protein KUG78_21915 [Kangiellaceae bacterium]|nr:hypothetical protein [Kangiellaceae bacterium]
MNDRDLESEARKYAIRLVNYCTSEPNYPSSKHNFMPPVACVVAGRLKAFCVNHLGLKKISENSIDEVVEKLTPAILITLNWTISGYEILYDQIGESVSSYPNSHFLGQFASQNRDNNFINETIHEAYYLLCLKDLADYEDKIFHSFMEKELFAQAKLKADSYEVTISALGSLICAQDAFERAQSELWQLAGQLGQESLKEEHEQNMNDTILFGRGKEKIDSLNRENKKKAEERWRPLVNEVKNILKKESKHNATSASIIVARRHKVNPDTLRKNLYKYND